MGGRQRVLVVEDEADIAEIVAYNLKKEGFDVDAAPDGEAALRKIRAGRFDLVVLDLMLPGMGGTELCRILRGGPKTAALPIIMLTAKSEEVDRVLGLELGADDYITKPFSVRELLARVKAVLRRTGEKAARAEAEKGEKVIKLGGLVIDKDAYRASKKGVPLKLSSTEFRLLLYLAERRGRVFSRDQLLDAVWKGEAYVEPRTVDVHIRRLRAQVEDDPSEPAYIKTMRGVGYYMEGEG
jgi:phosphate regulon transcriptional regulator PhoB